MGRITIWLHGPVARVLVRDNADNIIDTCDVWNNIASAQAWCYSEYSDFKQTTLHNPEHIREANRDWATAVSGN